MPRYRVSAARPRTTRPSRSTSRRGIGPTGSRLGDGKPVTVWPDSSGNGRDLSATAGVRPGGVGTAPTFAAKSSIHGRPAVRFDTANGLASSPDLPVDITGDAALTMVVVVNLRPHDAKPPHDGVLGIGDPANPGRDPGRPLAALIQIERTAGAELQFAGGWNHNATLGPGSFQPHFDKPLLLTVVKSPGAMKTGTRFFLNGVPSDDKTVNRPVGGRETVPDIRHRTDIGLYLGKALEWCGSIRGDVAEVVVFNRALADDERAAVERDISARNGFLHPSVQSLTRAAFTPAQKSFWAFQPVRPVAVPEVRDANEIRTDIDRFVGAKLEAAGLTFSPPADKRTLIRRVTFDLTGLPPTPEEIEAFLKDDTPGAFATVVDRLLASPHYGERWGRHWLDVVRYAEIDRQRRERGHAVRLALPRLRRPVVQRRHALRRVRRRATRGRLAPGVRRPRTSRRPGDRHGLSDGRAEGAGRDRTRSRVGSTSSTTRSTSPGGRSWA